MHERDVLEVKLPVRQLARQEIALSTRFDLPDGHWLLALPPPSVIRYEVLDAEGRPVGSGLIANGTHSELNAVGLERGREYRLRVPGTMQLEAGEPTEPFLLGPKTRALSLVLTRRTAPVDLIVRATSRLADMHHWSNLMPLLPLFDVLVYHKRLATEGRPCVIMHFFVEGEKSAHCARSLDRQQLYVGEKYVVQIGCSLKVQHQCAARRIRSLMTGKAIHFNGAGDETLASIEQSWSIDYACLLYTSPSPRDS